MISSKSQSLWLGIAELFLTLWAWTFTQEFGFVRVFIISTLLVILAVNNFVKYKKLTKKLINPLK